MVEIELKGDTAVRAQVDAYPGRVGRALVRALNRGIKSARAFMAKAIAEDTGLKQKDVREALRFKLATLGRPEAALAASLKKIPLIKFGARGPEPSRGRGNGVTYRLKGSRGRHPNAFIATMSSGHRGVFVRVGNARKSAGAWSPNLPILELKPISIGHVFEKFRPQGQQQAIDVMTKNLAHELQWASKDSPASA